MWMREIVGRPIARTAALDIPLRHISSQTTHVKSGIAPLESTSQVRQLLPPGLYSTPPADEVLDLATLVQATRPVHLEERRRPLRHPPSRTPWRTLEESQPSHRLHSTRNQ